MKVLVGGNEYWIEFEYASVIRKDERGEPVVCDWHRPERMVDHETEKEFSARLWEWASYRTDQTTCLIRNASGGHTTDRPPVVASGRVVRHYRDVPNRELGRKAALKKALEDLNRKILSWYVQDDASGSEPLTARHRNRFFWDVYLNRKKAKGVAA